MQRRSDSSWGIWLILIFGVLAETCLAQWNPLARLQGLNLKQGDQAIAPQRIDLTLEVFSFPSKDLNGLLRTGSDDREIYRTVLARLTEEEVKQVLFQSVLVQSGKAVRIADGKQALYPTEYEPAGGVWMPPTLGAFEELYQPGRPTCFESRQLGWSSRFVPRFNRISGLIEIESDVRFVEWVDNDLWGQTPCVAVMPRMSLDLSRSNLVLGSGEVSFLGKVGEEDQGGLARLVFLTARTTEVLPKPEPKMVPQFGIRYEVISLPAPRAAGIRRRFKGDRIYPAIQDGLEKGAFRKVVDLCGRSSEASLLTLKEVTEFTHPSDYNPPGSLDSGPRFNINRHPMMLAARRFSYNAPRYEEQNLGTSFQGRVWLTEEGNLLVKAEVEESRLLRRNAFGQGISQIEMPDFGVQRLSTVVRGAPGRSIFLGTLNEIENSEFVRWAFLRVDRIK